MKTYAITFYLKEESHSCGCADHDHDHHHHHRDDYEITARIKSLGAWAHFMPTSFLLKSELSAEEIKEQLKIALEPSDMLFVSEVNKENVASLTQGVTEWISK